MVTHPSANECEDRQKQAREFVTELYGVMLGRHPDDGGLDYFADKMLRGTSQGELIRMFMAGDEFLERQVSRVRAILAERGREGELNSKFPLEYQPPGEAGRCYVRRVRSGFMDLYCGGDLVLDVGFSGYNNPERKTSIPGAIGIDLDYPGYDGITLPFADASVDTVLSSHCLEHILYDHAAIRGWFRVLRVGGYIVCMVPHQGLYEKKQFLPSRWNQDHKRMYTPATLLKSFEEALDLNSYRVRHLADNDRGFNYALGPDTHSDGAYEIELVIEKIVPPGWSLE